MSAGCRRRSTRRSDATRRVLSLSARQTGTNCRRSIQSFFPSAERQTRAREERLDRPLATLRLSESSGDPALTKAGQHPRPDDSHGACSLTVRERSGRLTSTAFVAVDRSTAVQICAPTLAMLHAPCEVFGTKTELRRPIASVRSGAFPRARVCLSKLWERPRTERRVRCGPNRVALTRQAGLSSFATAGCVSRTVFTALSVTCSTSSE